MFASKAFVLLGCLAICCCLLLLSTGSTAAAAKSTSKRSNNILWAKNNKNVKDWKNKIKIIDITEENTKEEKRFIPRRARNANLAAAAAAAEGSFKLKKLSKDESTIKRWTAVPSFLLATSFPSVGTNTSLVQMNTTDGSFIKSSSSVGSTVIDHYSHVAFDPVSRTLFFVGVFGWEGFIHMINADTLDLVHEVYILDPYGVPAEMTFDAKLQVLFGIAGSTDGTSFTISQYDLKTGDRDNWIESMEDVVGISLSCLVYDQRNHIYYISALTSNHSMPFAMYAYDLSQRQLVKKIPVPDFIQNAQFDPKSNMIVGVTVDDEFATLDLTSGKFTVYTREQMDLESIGFRELGASGIDVNNGFYYVLYSSHTADTHMVKIDYRKVKIVNVWPWYKNHIGTSIFVPGTTNFF